MHMVQKKTFTQKLKMINNIMRVAPTEEENDQQEIKPEKPKSRKKKNRDHKDQRTRKEEKEQTIIPGIAKRGGRRRKKKKKRTCGKGITIMSKNEYAET